ncbi:5806_t:CDS:2, partial [Racocetra fulgida]
GLIIIYGGVGKNNLQAQPSVALLNVDVSPFTDLYIFNTQDRTWVDYFDASNIYGSNSDNNSLSLGAKIGICIAVVVAFVVIGAAGFFIYKKYPIRNNYRNSIATPGTSTKNNKYLMSIENKNDTYLFRVNIFVTGDD